MKNSPVDSSRNARRSGNSMCARLTPSRIIIGVLSITLLLCSLISAFAEVTSIRALAANASTGVNSVTNRILVPIDTSTLVNAIIIPIKHTPKPGPHTPKPVTPTPTPTMATPTPTPTRVRPTPTPTMGITPTPIPTRAVPTPAHTPTSPPPTTSTTSSSLIPGTTTKATTKGLPGTTYTNTAVVATPDSSQGQTQATQSTFPTDSVVQSTGQGQKNSTFPFIPLIIELFGSVAVIYFVFIGRRYLNNRKLAKTWNSPSSGAYSWSGELTNNTPWDTNQNANYNYNGYNGWVSDSSVPYGYDGATATMSQAPDGSWPTLQNGDYAPSNDMYFPMNNDPAYVPPSTPHPELFESQGMGMGNDGHETDADEQWSPDNNEGYADFNDPYLQGILKQYSEKSKDAWQQRDEEGKG